MNRDDNDSDLGLNLNMDNEPLDVFFTNQFNFMTSLAANSQVVGPLDLELANWPTTEQQQQQQPSSSTTLLVDDADMSTAFASAETDASERTESESTTTTELPLALRPADPDDLKLQEQLFNATGDCPALPTTWDKKACFRFAKLFALRNRVDRLFMFRPKFYVWARTDAKHSRDVTDVIYCSACDNATGFSMSMLHDQVQCNRHIASHRAQRASTASSASSSVPSSVPSSSSPSPPSTASPQITGMTTARISLAQLDTLTLLTVCDQTLNADNASQFAVALSSIALPSAELQSRVVALSVRASALQHQQQQLLLQQQQQQQQQQHVVQPASKMRRTAERAETRLAPTTPVQQRQAMAESTLVTLQQIGQLIDEASSKSQIAFYLKHFGVGSEDSVRDRCMLFDSSFLRAPQCAPFLTGCVANLCYSSQGATEHRRRALLLSLVGQKHPPADWMVRGSTWAKQCRAVVSTPASSTANHVNALRKVELEFIYRIFDLLVREFARGAHCDITQLKLMTRREIREHACFAFVRQAIHEQCDLSTFERWLRETLQLCLPLDLFAALYAFGDDWYSERHYITLVHESAAFAAPHEAQFAATLRRRTDGNGRQIADRMNKWFEWMLAFLSDEHAALFDVFLTPLFWVRVNAVQERLHYVDLTVTDAPYCFVPCGDEHEPFVRGANSGQSELSTT
jgi:hypothetical protein